MATHKVGIDDVESEQGARIPIPVRAGELNNVIIAAFTEDGLPDTFRSDIPDAGTSEPASTEIEWEFPDEPNEINSRRKNLGTSQSKLKPWQSGYIYNGSEATTKPSQLVENSSDRSMQVKWVAWNELYLEGGNSAINAYDGELLSW